jgi:sphingomyelin phosphodiesterase acid-like 3
MSKISRYLFLLVIGNVLWISGCGAGDPAPATPASIPSTYTVVAISDIHFNPLANPALFPSLVAQPANEWKSIFDNAQSTTAVPPATFGADTNYPALVLALAALKQNLGSSPVVLFSGDMLGHDLTQCFYELYTASPLPSQLNPATCPLNPATTAPETAAMQSFLDKTLAFVSMQIRANVGNVPVIFVPGNIDTYNITGTGPDAQFLADNASTYYTQLLNSSVDQTSFQSTFTTLGSYSAQPLGSNLLVIALDSKARALARACGRQGIQSQ